MSFERFIPPKTERQRLVCAECRERMVHRLITLHAEEDTLIVCSGAWEGLTQWLRDAFNNTKGKGIEKRREAVNEIREHLEKQ